MPSARIALEVAAYLDSPMAARAALPPGEQRRIVEAFLEACHDDQGVAPHLLDDQTLAAVLTTGLPARLRTRDPLAEHLPAVLRAYLAHLEETRPVSQAYELRRALEEALPGVVATIQRGENRTQVARTEKPFVHRASKTSRNDPCSCGSGKKFKKCHGRGT
jgi:hypothetical protein